jgi:hypothetical protein
MELMMNVDAQVPMDGITDGRDGLGADPQDPLQFSRLSIEDLNGLALTWRIKAQRGDRTTAAIAGALTSVARRRRAAALVGMLYLAGYRACEPFRKFGKLAGWSASR